MFFVVVLSRRKSFCVFSLASFFFSIFLLHISTIEMSTASYILVTSYRRPDSNCEIWVSNKESNLDVPHFK